MKGALRFLICGALLLSASAQNLEAQNTADTPWKKTEAVGSTWREFTTWPMQWPGSAPNWIELKELYGFGSDEDALAYRQNPIDLLPEIAKAGIKLRHVVSVTNEHDTRVVPNDSNTFRAAGILSRLGSGIDLAILPPETVEPPYPTDSASVRFIVEASAGR